MLILKILTFICTQDKYSKKGWAIFYVKPIKIESNL